MPRAPTRQRNTTQSFSPEPKQAQRLAKQKPPVQTKTTTMAEPRRASSSTRSFAPSGGTQSFAPEPKPAARLADKPAPPQVKRTTVAEPTRPSRTTQSFSPSRGTQSFSPPAQPAPRLASNPTVNRPAPAPSPGSAIAKGLGKIPIVGAIIGAAVGGNQIKDLPGSMKARSALVDWAASKTGLAAKEQAINAPTKYTPKPRQTSVAPGGTSPAVPSKTMQEAPKPSTPKGSTSPARKSAPKPSQKATGPSKRQGKAMSGAELANFLGLSADSAVRTYMETGKHKYPSKKK
jgi:hypothetical protein